MASGETMVVEKQFGAEYAGERVGWIAVHESPQSEGFRLINVAAATVGEAGAALKYRDVDGERAYISRDDGGFENATGLYVAVEPDDSVRMEGVYRYVAADKGDNAMYMRNNGMSQLVKEEDKQWASRKQELPEVIKATLRTHNIESVYPYVYYNLNIMGAVARGEFGLFNPAPDELLVPDPAMSEQTSGQIETVHELLNAVQAVHAEDELMARRLTVFSDIVARQIPDTFVESREKVAGLERSMKSLQPNMYAGPAIYIPPGAGRGGRSWPYMDPNGKTPRDSYGPELNELRAGAAGRAAYQLGLEISEAAYRVQHVQKRLDLLKRLNILERV